MPELFTAAEGGEGEGGGECWKLRKISDLYVEGKEKKVTTWL